MARKRSASGRARARTMENNLNVQVLSRVNKAIRSLEKGGNFGKWKSKELLRFISQTRGLSLKKGKRSKRHKVYLVKSRISPQDHKLISKKLKEILKSRAFSNIGIEKIKVETRQKLAETLGEDLGRKATDEDIERFYDIVNNVSKAKQESLLSRVEPSDFNHLVIESNKYKYSEDKFAIELATIANIDDINSLNNMYLRMEARDLYYKYVV